MAEQRRIKCRFCDYSVLPFYVGKDGKRRSGMARLMNHIEDAHAGRMEALHDEIAERRPDKLERTL